MDDGEFEFWAELTIQMVGTYRYHAVLLPADLQNALTFPKRTRMRISGELNDVPFAGAWIPDGRGRYFTMIGAALRRNAGLELGEPVHVRFRVEDPEYVDVPEYLMAAIETDPAALCVWEDLTPGKKRGIVHLVTSAKTGETRAKRIRNVVESLASGPP